MHSVLSTAYRQGNIEQDVAEDNDPEDTERTSHAAPTLAVTTARCRHGALPDERGECIWLRRDDFPRLGRGELLIKPVVHSD